MALFVIFFYITKLFNFAIPEGFQVIQVAVLWINQLCRRPQDQRSVSIDVFQALSPLSLGRCQFLLWFPVLPKSWGERIMGGPARVASPFIYKPLAR